MKQFISFILVVTVLSACSRIPEEVYGNRGDPEGLLDVSSEIVNLDVSSEVAVEELGRWMEQDQPSRAELYCLKENPACAAAMGAMEVYGVEYYHIPSSEFTATLVYERVLARDCLNRFVDNSVNPYNLHHPSFGCSLAVNMVQQVDDKAQFVRPSLLGPADSRKAIQAYQNYMTRRRVDTQQAGIADSLLSESAETD